MALKDYVDTNFPQPKAQLSWSDSVDVQAIIDHALELYGVATEALATDAKKIHALLAVAVWWLALSDLALDYGFSADGASYSRNQAVEQVRSNLREAESAAIVYMPNYQMIVHPNDPNPDWSS